MQMRRQRTIKPSFLRDERVTKVPPGMRFLAVELLFWADDHGRAELLPKRMHREMLGSDASIDPAQIEHAVAALAETQFLHVYEDEDGRTLFQIARDLLGTVDRRNPSTYPAPTFANDFANRFANRGLGEREGARARVEFESAREWASDEGDEGEGVRLPPSPFCKRHPAGFDHPCTNCGTARLRSHRWVLLERQGKPNAHLEVDLDDESPWDLTQF